MNIKRIPIIILILSLVIVGIVSADPYMEPYTISLQHFNGTQGQTSFIEENASINWGGGYPGRTFINTSTFKFGSSSLYFGDGGTNYPVNQTNMAMRLPVVDHTVEFWVYLPTTGSVAQQLVAKDIGGIPYYQLYMGADNVVQMYYNSTTMGTSGNWLPRGTWNSVAIVKNNTEMRLYINGTLKASQAVVPITSLTTTTPFWIGSGNARTQPVLPGTFFDEFRVSNTSRYSGASYTPQTSEFQYWIVTTDTLTSSFTMTNMTEASVSSATNVTGDAPFLVQFTNTSTGNNQSSWVWNHTALSTGIPVTFNQTAYGITQYNFTTPDNYFIKLNVSGSSGQNISTQTAWVNVTAPHQVFANFTANTSTPKIPSAYVQFTDVSSYKHDQWLWTFGDGSTSSEQNPIHQYTSLGYKNVSLTVWRSDNLTNTDTKWINNTILVSYSNFYIDPDFLGTPTSGSPGLLVSFTDLTIVGNSTAARTCNWSFGDSLSTTPYSNLCGNVQHVYAYAGVYDVNLSVTILGNTSYELKTQYITISSNQQTTWYTPAQVELTTVDEYGNGISGVLVSGTPINFTAPDNWAEILIGIQPTVNMSGTTVYGFTGTDGSWAAPVLQSYRYHWTFVNGSDGINQEATFYPTDPTYRIWITTGAQQNYTYSQVASTNLTFTQPDAGNMTLGMNYYDSSGLTYMVNFTVYDYHNDTVYFTQSITGAPLAAIVTSSYTLPNIRGNEYVWKYQAYRTDGSVLAQGNSVMGKGLSGVLVDLGLPVDWYRWISVCILFLIGSMSSQRTKQYWAILIPVFAAIFFWFGWFTGQSTLIGIVTLCAVLGVIVYMKSSLREKFGIGGPGTFILNLVAYLIILQACIGFINGLGVWDASTSVAIDSQYKNVEITQDIPNLTNAGGVLGDVMAISTILFDLAFTMLRVLLSILGAIAFIYPTIAQMFPLVAASPQATAFLLLLQVGIWMTYAFFLYRLYKGDVGGVEL